MNPRSEKILKQIETVEDEDNQNNEYRRQLIIEAAIQAADEIIMECSDGSVEETDYLTSAVAQKFNEKVHSRISGALLRRDYNENKI